MRRSACVTQQLLDRREVSVGQHLVGDQRAACAGRDADRELCHGGEGEAPGAGLELAREELRRHRGLAVRRQVDAPVPHLLLHPGQVVRDGVALEQRDREWQVAGQHVPAGLAHLAAAQRAVAVREALEAGADDRVEQV